MAQQRKSSNGEEDARVQRAEAFCSATGLHGECIQGSLALGCASDEDIKGRVEVKGFNAEDALRFRSGQGGFPG